MYSGPTSGFGERGWGSNSWGGVGTILDLGATWGNGAWGEGAWGENVNVSVSGTGAVGTVTFAISDSVVPVGVAGTGAIGTAVIV